MRHVITVLLVTMFLSSILHPGQEKVRNYLTTGNWYPGDKQQLDKLLDSCFKASPAATKEIEGRIVGLIAPHAAFVFSGRCAAAAYSPLSKQKGIRRVILLGVSHHGGFYGACVADFTHFSTPLGRLPVDSEAIRLLAVKKHFIRDDDIMQQEHSLENQLPFLQKALAGQDFKIVPILFGGLKIEDFTTMADAIRPLADVNTLVVASTDLTHYGAGFGYEPFQTDIAANLTRLDQGLLDCVRKLDLPAYIDYFKKTGITACGFVPVGVLMALLSARGDCRVQLCDYYKSGDLNNDYSTSVSYASLLFTRSAIAAAVPAAQGFTLSRDEKKTLLKIARDSLQGYLTSGKDLEPDPNTYLLTGNLQKKLGVFVTLRENGELRGCIGTIIGIDTLCRSVAENAVSSAVRDPRFPAVTAAELQKIDIEISVLTPLARIPDYRRIRLGTDGVIIRDGHFQAVFLPQVATETGWNLEQFLTNLCRKAGLAGSAFQESKTMEFHVFQAIVFDEKQLLK